MKREREADPAGPAAARLQTSAAAHFTILSGLTRETAERVGSEYRRGGLQESNAFLPISTSSSQMPFVVLVDYLCDMQRTKASGATPARLETVHLVANDGQTLVCSPSTAAEPVTISVDKEVGERLVPGDVVWTYDVAPEAEESQAVCRVELVGVNPEILPNGSEWADAAGRNTLAAVHWAANLLQHPPGIGQLSFLYECACERGAGRAGWIRALQLPRFLSPDTVEVLALGHHEQRVMQRLRRSAMTILRTLVAVMVQSQSFMPLPHLLQKVLLEFLTSSLFMDGFLAVFSLRAPNFLTSSELHTMVDTFQSVLQMALPLLSVPSHCSGWHSATAAAAVANGRRETEAGERILAVLHRLSDVGLEVTAPSSTHPLRDPMEEFVRSGATQELLDWLQARESEAERRKLEETTVIGSTGLLWMAHRPPTLRMILQDMQDRKADGAKSRRGDRKSGCFFESATHLQGMRETYNPYRTHDAIRFVEFATLAAFAELYGPSSKAVEQLLELWPPNEKNAQTQMCLLPVDDARQTTPDALPSSAEGKDGAPLLATLSLHRLRHSSQFGLPVHLSVKKNVISETTVKHLKKRLKDVHLAGADCGDRGSLFGYVVGEIGGAKELFPVLITDIKERETNALCTVYVLRDGDMLPQFVSLAQLASEDRGEAPPVWLVTSCEEREKKNVDDPLSAPDPQLFPSSTPALTYIDFIQRMQVLCQDLKTTAARRHSRTPASFFNPLYSHGLWLQYFASEAALPTQKNHTHLLPSTSSVLSGTAPRTENGPENLMSVLERLSEWVPFTPSQMEALHALTEEAPTPPGQRSNHQVLSNLRVVEGIMGSGKSAVVTAVGLAKGLQLEAARREQQRGLRSSIQRSTAVLRAATSSMLAAESMESIAVGEAAEKGRWREHIPEDDMLEAALTQMEELKKLALGSQHCSSPLLVRLQNHRRSSPLFKLVLEGGSSNNTSQNEENQRPTWLTEDHFETLLATVNESISRCANAPLGKILTQRLLNLWKVASWCSDLLQDPPGRLQCAAIPFLMDRGALDDTVSAAAKHGTSWRSYMETQMWPAVPHAVIDTPLGLPAGEEALDRYWAPCDFPSTAFEPVEPVDGMPFSALTPDQASGVHHLLSEAQVSWAQHILGGTLEMLRQVLVLYEELVFGVAAISHTNKLPVLTSSAEGLLHDGLLPFLWRWSPSHLLLDDFDTISDGIFLLLPAVNHLVLTSSLHTPMALSQSRSAAKELLRDLLRSLAVQKAAQTSALRETHRCEQRDLLDVLRDWTHTGGGTGAALAPRGEDPDAELRDRERGCRPLAGLASVSAVEGWSHAGPLATAVEADARAAAFLLSRLQGFHRSASSPLRVYFPFEEDLLQSRPYFPSDEVLRWVPFQGASGMPEEESHIAVLCLSGLLLRLERSTTKSWWELDTAEPGGLLEQRLECWLWRVASRVRTGLVVIADRHLFHRIPLLGKLEHFIASRRETSEQNYREDDEEEDNGISLTELRQYWLPAKVRCAVMAFQCPQHYKCRYIAAVSHHEGESGVQIATHGSVTCESLCVLPYKNCSCAFHACLERCHYGCISDGSPSPPLDESDMPPPDLTHCSCPYPCVKTLPCGHLCLHKCGETSGGSCPPCRVMGLTELTCGQRVVSGTRQGRNLQFRFFPHFQRRPCGAPALPCDTPVRITCLRCSTTTEVRCETLQTVKSLRRQKERQLESARPDEVVDAETEDCLLRVMDCRGCVAMLNKVAEAIQVEGYEPLALPSEVWTPTADLEAIAPERVWDDVPAVFRDNVTVKAALDATVARETRKASLLQLKEALEISNNGGGPTSQFSVFQAVHERHLAQVEDEKREHKESAEREDAFLLRRLRAEAEKQTQRNMELENMMPSLLSVAVEEIQRQEAAVYR